jgi:hypothetical protein
VRAVIRLRVVVLSRSLGLESHPRGLGLESWVCGLEPESPVVLLSVESSFECSFLGLGLGSRLLDF